MQIASGKLNWVQPNSTGLSNNPAAQGTSVQRPFSEMLKRELKAPSVSFSAHAMERMKQRNIFLHQDDMVRLSEAIDKATAKGARDTLVIERDMAFVVGVQNRTVVTVMDTAQSNDHVFTNIDSAVLM